MIQLCMVTWDRLNYTKKAIESVLNQDEENFKLTIVDNGSKDGTVEYLKTLEDPRIDLVLWERNKGLSTATHHVFKDSEEDYLGRVDNDTILPPDWLRRCIEAHEGFDNFGFIGGFHFQKEDMKDIEPRIEIFDGIGAWRKPHIGGCSFLIKNEDYKKFGKIGGEGVMGLTDYQHKFTDAGKVNAYLYPFIWVDHQEDRRSPNNDRSQEYENYSVRCRNMDSMDYTIQFRRDAESYLNENTK